MNPTQFDKQWKEGVSDDPFKAMAAHKEFFQKLYPNGAPQDQPK